MSDDDRGLLKELIELLAYFDPIDRVEGMISTFLNADWRGAYARRGALGIVIEFVACVFSHNSPTIYFDRCSSWRGIDVERLLKRHGIKVWDRGIADKYTLYFCVKRRQVKWAEYLALRAGVPVVSGLHDARIQGWADRARETHGKEPPSSYRPGLIDRILKGVGL